MKKVVNWVAQIQYPGKEPIWYGTLVADSDATGAEILSEMGKEIRTHLPDGFDIKDLKRGQIWLTFD